MNSFSMGFHPNKAKSNKVTGKTPIFVRFLIDGKKIERRIPEQYDLEKNELAKWNFISQRLDIKNSDVNNYLSSIEIKKKLLDLEGFQKIKQYTTVQLINKILVKEEEVQEITLYKYLPNF